MTTQDDFAAMLPVAEAFELLRIPYYIGGSVASSTHGIARSTLDIDIVARVQVHDAPALTRALESHFYIDEEMIRQAVRTSSSFNIIHYELQHKIDVFIDKKLPTIKPVGSA